MSQSPLSLGSIPAGVVLAALAAPAPSQSVLVVDPNGGGDCRTVAQAVAVARSGDQIHVRKGTYRESLVVDGKAVTILGVAADPSEVVIAGARLRNHPAGARTTLARVTLTGSGVSLETSASRGELVLDAVTASHGCRFTDHDGTISLSGCTIRAPRASLRVANVTHLFCHETRFLTSAVNVDAVHDNVTVAGTTAHFAGCEINGSRGSAVRGLDGGTALHARDAKVRISGLQAHTITGGDGVRGGAVTTLGGVGIHVRRTELWVTGARVRGGSGELFGRVFRAPAIRRGDRSSTIHTPAVAAPYVAAPGMARGASTRVDVAASAGAQSVTWVGLRSRPFPTPFGAVAIDFTQPVWSVPLQHDANGHAHFDLDLRAAAARDVGLPFVIQTVAISGGGQVCVSGPRFGIVTATVARR